MEVGNRAPRLRLRPRVSTFRIIRGTQTFLSWAGHQPSTVFLCHRRLPKGVTPKGRTARIRDALERLQALNLNPILDLDSVVSLPPDAPVHPRVASWFLHSPCFWLVQNFRLSSAVPHCNSGSVCVGERCHSCACVRACVRASVCTSVACRTAGVSHVLVSGISMAQDCRRLAVRRSLRAGRGLGLRLPRSCPVSSNNLLSGAPCAVPVLVGRPE